MFKRANGKIIWLYGRPCSGKSSLASSISEILKDEGISVITLDGDELRNGMNGDLDLELIYVHASLEICKKRDVKGHYLKAKAGLIPDFTDITSPFEETIENQNIIETDQLTIQQATKKGLDLILNS